MRNNSSSSLLKVNKLEEIPAEDQTPQSYLEVVKAFARLTYESVYLIDYTNMSFEYVSDNPLFLCGYTAKEVLQLGYEFFFRHVPEKDLEFLALMNEAAFAFYADIPLQERKKYSIRYDFHLIDKKGKQILVNHKLTPLFLTKDGRMWKSICIVSLSPHQTAGNVHISKEGSSETWELNVTTKKWYPTEKPVLTERELEVLRLHAQGLSIQQIAEKIFVSPDTVKYYRRRIFQRLEVSNIMDALSHAVTRKLM